MKDALLLTDQCDAAGVPSSSSIVVMAGGHGMASTHSLDGFRQCRLDDINGAALSMLVRQVVIFNGLAEYWFDTAEHQLSTGSTFAGSR